MQYQQANPFDLLSAPPGSIPQNNNINSAPAPAYHGSPHGRDDMSYTSAPYVYPSESSASVVSHQSYNTVSVANPPPPQGRITNELEMAYANPASPLPLVEKIVASGFILTRISFRTILFKKWKQGYWIQYGPNTMYFFRSVADYEDWLKNPYHEQRERDYLVKLKIDFIADILPQDVREYRITQMTRKNYGRNKPLYHQFKLERVMEFGPTIVAAFASQDPNEVNALRRVIHQCIRNASNARGWGHAPMPSTPIVNGNQYHNGAVAVYQQQRLQGYQNYQY